MYNNKKIINKMIKIKLKMNKIHKKAKYNSKLLQKMAIKLKKCFKIK